MSDQLDIQIVKEAFAQHRDGRFLIDERVAAGGMGTVFRGTDTEFELPCAIKMFNPELLSKEHLVERFIAEAKIIRRLAHPAIVAVYEVGRIVIADQGEIPYIALEWVDGGSLGDLITRYNGLPPDVAVKLLIRVCSGIEYAHARGAIHRDIKPDNILLTPSGEPKVTDFGIARMEHAMTHRTQDGLGMGSPGYMAPEQVEANKVDVRADVHALGVTLWAALKGSDPPRSFFFTSSLDEHPEDLAWIPPLLRPIIVRAVRSEPADRHATVAEFRQELEAVVDRLPVSTVVSFATADDKVAMGLVRLPSFATITPQAVETSHDLHNPTSVTAFQRQLGETRRRARKRLALVGVPVLAGLVALGVWFARSSEDQPIETVRSTTTTTEQTSTTALAQTKLAQTPVPIPAPLPVPKPDGRQKPVSAPVTMLARYTPDDEAHSARRLLEPWQPTFVSIQSKSVWRPAGAQAKTQVKPQPKVQPTAPLTGEPAQPVVQPVVAQPALEKVGVRVSLSDDTIKVWLVGPSGRQQLSAGTRKVLPGGYKVVAKFGDLPELVTISHVEVVKDTSPKLTCNSEATKCRWH